LPILFRFVSHMPPTEGLYIISPRGYALNKIDAQNQDIYKEDLMKHPVFSLIFCLLLVFSFTALAQQGPEVITFWYSLDDDGAEALEGLVAEFNKEEKGKIEVTTKCFSSDEELKTALLKGGQYPHVAIIDNRWQGELIALGALSPVGTHMDNIGSSIRIMYKADTPKPIYESCFQDNTLWTAAFSCNNTALLVNLDFLYSLNMTQSPQEWADLLKVGKPIMETADGRFGLALPTDEDPEDMAAFFIALVRQEGGNLLDEEGKLIFNSADGVAALQFLQDLYQTHKIASVDVPPDAFFVGQIGMTFGDSHDYFRALELGMNVEAVYCPKKDSRASDLHIRNLALFKSDKDREKASFKFLFWLTEYQQMRDLYLTTAFVPANKQVVASPQYFEYMNAHPGMRVFLKQLQWATPVPNFTYYDEIMEYLGNSVMAALKGEKTPQQALDEAANYGNGLMGFEVDFVAPPPQEQPVNTDTPQETSPAEQPVNTQIDTPQEKHLEEQPPQK